VVATALGEVVLRGGPEPEDAWGPVLVAVPSRIMPSDMLRSLAERLTGSCSIYFTDLPSSGAPNRDAELISRALHEAFLGRPVVLTGRHEAAAVVALCYAPELLRTVAIDPLMEAEDGADLRSAYGGRRAPLDVVASEAGSLSAEHREWLQSQASVEIFDIGEGDSDASAEVLKTALTWADRLRRDPDDMARRLAAATPRTARRVRFAGAAFETFASAYRTYNPDGEVTTDADECDVLAVLAPGACGDELSAQVATLKPGGWVVALTPLGPDGARLQTALAAHGLSPSLADAQLTPLGMRLVRASKAPQPPSVRIELVAYANYLMDIRTRLPTDGLRSEPDLDMDLYLPPLVQVPAKPRIVILQRPPHGSPSAWRTIAARAILAGQVIVIEFDDHPDLTSLMRRGRHATDEEWEQFRVAHAIQTSTEDLAPVFCAHNPEVRVFPNCVFDLPPFPDRELPLRVFYGAASRGPFAVDVAKALRPAIEAFPSVEFHVVGDRAVFEALPTDRKRFEPLLPYDQYLAAMARCSVSLSPLEPSPMVETKSDAKYLDAARSGVLTLASATLYEKVIRHGETGLLARSLDDWPQLLAQALGDLEARRRMTRAAWNDVRTHRMFSQQIPGRRDWYRDLLARRDALNTALLERSPGVAETLARLTAALR
jgi:hypothetical protein